MLKVHIDSFNYNGNLTLRKVSFSVEKGKHLAIMGESGSGKSTLLKIIYGLLHIEKGSIFWDEKQALGPNFKLIPGESHMKYLSQNLDLMPFTTVEENIADHLSIFTKETHDGRINELLELIQLTGHAKVKVKNLSGGQQQRVALAKVLAQEPEVLLLDEPFGHIDNSKRNSLRRKLFPYLKRKNITVLTVSHDLGDVLPFSDRTLVLQNGRSIADQETKKLYENPPSYYVASLFSEVNKVHVGLLGPSAQMNGYVLIYPHEFNVSDSSGMRVRVATSYFRGSHFLNEGETEDKIWLYFNTAKKQEPGTSVFLSVPRETVALRLNGSGTAGI